MSNAKFSHRYTMHHCPKYRKYKGLKISYINDPIKLEGLGVRNTDLQ